MRTPRPFPIFIGCVLALAVSVRVRAERPNILFIMADDREFARAGYQKYLKRYLRCVKGVDDNVKRLVDFLRETGELENTLLIYTGDQGFFLGEHDLMDKR